MNENAPAKGTVIHMDLETSAIFEVRGQKLYVDRQFAKIWDSFWLKTEDISRLAGLVCDWLHARGWFIPQPGIAFVVDVLAHPENIFSFVPVQETEDLKGLTAVINAHRRALDDTENKERKIVARLEKKARLKELKRGLRAKLAMYLAHELTHAFGINLRSPFGRLPVEELEILTDSCAFLSCQSWIGEEAERGANYLDHELRKQGTLPFVDKVRGLAKTVVASASRSPAVASFSVDGAAAQS